MFEDVEPQSEEDDKKHADYKRWNKLGVGNKVSEMFEGEDSSLRKTFDDVVTRFSDMETSGKRTEWICSHGVGHHRGVHGCDGCCANEPKMDQTTKDKEEETRCLVIHPTSSFSSNCPTCKKAQAEVNKEFYPPVPELIATPVYYNKFSQYICDKNDIPLMELVGEDDSVGQFISEAINNFK